MPRLNAARTSPSGWGTVFGLVAGAGCRWQALGSRILTRGIRGCDEGTVFGLVAFPVCHESECHSFSVPTRAPRLPRVQIPFLGSNHVPAFAARGIPRLRSLRSLRSG